MCFDRTAASRLRFEDMLEFYCECDIIEVFVEEVIEDVDVGDDR